MSNILSHKGYSARIDYDVDDNILFGRIVGINDSVGFHSHDLAGIEKAFREAVEDYIETCAKAGKEPDRSYSGKVLLRVDPAIHARLAKRSELTGKSINQIGEEALVMALG